MGGGKVKVQTNTLKAEKKVLCLTSGHSREKVHRVTFLLDEVFPIFHELPQRDHGVVVNVELVVG